MFDLANELRYKRAMSRMSQREVADRLGVSRQTYHAWETGKQWPSDSNMRAVADFVEVPLESLL